MLAQNFLSHDLLGITEAERDALVKVLGMLERGELVHVPARTEAMLPNGFNLAHGRVQTDCGIIACIAGWAEIIGDLHPRSLIYGEWTLPMLHLFGGPSLKSSGDITVPEATLALRNYLTLGEPHWAVVLAEAA